MQFAAIVASLFFFFSVAFALPATHSSNAATVSITYDQTYDNGSNSLANVACSDGPNGLMTKGKLVSSSVFGAFG